MERIATLAILGLALIALGCGPIWMIPGGRLDGEVAATPSDWAIANDIEDLQLETRPGDPYSVNVWGAGVGDRFYIAAGRGEESTWAQNIAADPNVRLRVGEFIYELQATRIDDDAERDLFLAAVKKKYDWEPTEEEGENAVLFRLTPRNEEQ
ncbi:MAG: nitroreductase family deazaflavin-dependent oxidoreductase [Deltaproteobacteria bacterium]|nr:nitroreductase family deazaflavin-dependent oxidoreductase [Deltaproteobacteria bacterium]MBW2396348.1 nitroreductase family deazaflavin-dependent oxidoreductase [Deltaproteobacteria bacterium]